MKHLTFIVTAVLLAITLPASAQDKTDADWEAAYKKLMSNPEARAEIEAKGATKEQVIAWLKGKTAKEAYADRPGAAKAEKDVDWDAAYEKLLKERPDVARKVANGGATKEQVIAYLKNARNGGGKGGKGKGKGGKPVQIKDPRGFKQEGETAVYSGPQPGEKLPSFKVIGLHGKRKGEEYDPVKLAGDKPLVLIFQDNQVPGQKGLLLNGEVLSQIASKSPNGLEVHSVFLVDDPTPENVFEYDFKDRIPPIVQMGISKDRRDGPGSYGLNRNLGMTIIVAREGKVLHNFAMAQPMLYPNPYVLGAIAEAVEVKPETMMAWLAAGRKAGGEMMTMKAQGKKADAREKASEEKNGLGGEEAKMQRRPVKRATDVPGRGRTMDVKNPADFAKSQDKQIFSGPQPGEKLPTFKATSLFSDDNSKAVDIIKTVGDAPHVIVFQDRSRVAIRGLFGVSDAINRIKQKHKNLHMSVVFLDDDKEFVSRFAGRFADSLKDRGMDYVAAADDGRDGPGNYGLNRNIVQTIILAKGGKVTRSFVFDQGLLYADPYVLGGVAELIGEQREVVLKMVNVPTAREREAMAKTRFRTKLGELVRSGKITRAEAGDLWRAAFGDAAETDRPAADRRDRDRQGDSDRSSDPDRPRQTDRKRATDRPGDKK